MSIETVVSDELANQVVDTIIRAARSGTIGDGRVFVTPVHPVSRSERASARCRRPRRVLIDAVVRAQESGHIPPGNPEPIAYSVWAMAHGSAMLQLTHLRGF